MNTRQPDGGPANSQPAKIGDASRESRPGPFRHALPSAVDVAEHARRFGMPLETGAVAFRLDDGPVSDLPFCWAFGRAQIPVELAVPSGFVGDGRHVGVRTLRDLVRAGHSVANHSERHEEAPASLELTIQEIDRATASFAEVGVPLWNFVQPGSWVGSGRPGSLGDNAGTIELQRALAMRFLCVESYAGRPFTELPFESEVRLTLSHVTLDAMTWNDIERLLERVIAERLFAVLVLHTARWVRSLQAPLRWIQFLRLVRRCVALEERGRLKCTSVIGGACCGDARGESLLRSSPRSYSEAGTTEYEFSERPVPGVTYRLSCAGGLGLARPRAVVLLGNSRRRLRLVRRALAYQAIFGVDVGGDYRIGLNGPPGALGAVTVHVA